MSKNLITLLVDDSENDLLLLRMAFKRAGWTSPLQEVRNGVEATAYLEGAGQYGDRSKFPLPALMLLDLNMPLKSGFDVLDWVRQQPGLKRLPIFILSASMRPLDVNRAFDLGANAFLIKPSRIEELTNMVRSLADWLRHNQFPSLSDTVRT